MIDVQGNIEKVTQKCNELQDNQKVKEKKKDESRFPFLDCSIEISNK